MAHPLKEKITVTIQLFILHSFLAQMHVVLSSDEIPIDICGNSLASDGQSPLSSTSSSNRETLFSVLTSKASIYKFYNTSVGNASGDTDAGIVYGQFICLNYTRNDACDSCIKQATADITVKCPNSLEVIIWEETCQLRISRVNFFGKLWQQQYKFQKNPENISDPDLLGSLAKETLNDLAEEAAFSLKNDSCATKERNFKLNMNRTLYSLVQCAQDLSTEDCLTCLRGAITEVQNCCSMSLGARVLSPSCYLRYELYPFYDQTETPGDRGGAKKWKTVFLPIITVCLVAALFGSCFVRFTARRWKEEINKGEWRALYPHQFFKKFTDPQGEEAPVFDLRTILAATDRFSDKLKLGEGSFGPVYKGVLRDGTEVAVKRVEEIFSQQGAEEFRNEVLIIMKLQHSNLVRLLGFWAGGDDRLLVYEYMPNGSLDVFIFDPRRRMRLNWGRRLNIIMGIARGVLYLHEDSRQQIIHRDLKASNVLLEADLNPKISDFGIARIFAGTEGTANTTTIVGTYGYMAPEYAMEGLYSIKSDVYCFGVILLETVTGKSNAGFSSTMLAPSLLAYAWQMWNQGRALELMDPLLHGSCPAEEFIRCVHIGLLSVQEDALNRPTMSTVMVMLKMDSIILHQPQRPAFSTHQIMDDSVNIARSDGGSTSVFSVTVSEVMPR